MKRIIFFILLCCFTLYSFSQVLTAVSPTSAQQGQILTVSISGSNTLFSQATNTTIWFEQGSSTVILPFNILTVNNTTLSAFIQLNAQQPTGLYNLHVNNSLDGNLSLLNCFTVNINPNQAHLVSITPNTASQGDILNVTISGQNTNFNQGTNTITWFQQGSSTVIYPNNQNSLSATSMTANYSIPTSANTGFYDTYTYNNTDGLLVLNSGFYIDFPIIYNIQAAVNPVNSGSISGTGFYNNNQNCTITANNNTGYYFVNWTENGNIVSSNSTYSFMVNSDRNITANFSPINQFYINALSLPSFSGTTSGSGPYNLNQLATIQATPYSGWYFVNWTENGSMVSPDSIYSFNVNTNRTLVANFNMIISVPEISNDHEMLIFPNPAGSFINLKLNSGDKENVIIKMYDVSGKLVLNQTYLNEDTVKINVELLKNGVYFIYINQKDKEDLIKKLLIIK